MTAPILRTYQLNGVAGIRAAFARVKRVVYVLPTGGGKTVVFCYIALHAIGKGNSVLILTHRAEIIDQISRALDSFAIPHGRVQPGHPVTDLPCQVGMVQTVARRLHLLAPPNLIVADEAHHAISASWQEALAAFPDAKVLGVTATPERLDGRGLREVFDEMVIGPDVRALITEGHLADFRYLAPETAIDLSGLHTNMGDYLASEAAARVDRKAITGSVITHYRSNLGARSAIAFCCTVAHAEHVAEQFRAGGIMAASIDGSMTPDRRRDVVEALRSGTIKILTSCEVISEGFDAPAVGGAILLRPTASFAMYRQQVGRCLRPKGDGSKAIILDHVRNVDRHGLPDAAHKWSLDAKKRVIGRPPPPYRKCRACDEAFPFTATLADCPHPGTPECLFARGIPTEVAGSLTEIAERPSWTKGLNIREARGPEWFELLRRADGREDRLRTIQLVRGFRRGWVIHSIREHARAAGGGA